jgi:hypothetical protein
MSCLVPRSAQVLSKQSHMLPFPSPAVPSPSDALCHVCQPKVPPATCTHTSQANSSQVNVLGIVATMLPLPAPPQVQSRQLTSSHLSEFRRTLTSQLFRLCTELHSDRFQAWQPPYLPVPRVMTASPGVCTGPSWPVPASRSNDVSESIWEANKPLEQITAELLSSRHELQAETPAENSCKTECQASSVRVGLFVTDSESITAQFIVEQHSGAKNPTRMSFNGALLAACHVLQLHLDNVDHPLCTGCLRSLFNEMQGSVHVQQM